MKRPNSPTIIRLRITRDGFALVFGYRNRCKALFDPEKEAYDTNFKIPGILSNRSGSNTVLSFDNLSDTFRDVGWT